jgi:hypothetical protein
MKKELFLLNYNLAQSTEINILKNFIICTTSIIGLTSSNFLQSAHAQSNNDFGTPPAQSTTTPNSSAGNFAPENNIQLEPKVEGGKIDNAGNNRNETTVNTGGSHTTIRNNSSILPASYINHPGGYIHNVNGPCGLNSTVGIFATKNETFGINVLGSGLAFDGGTSLTQEQKKQVEGTRLTQSILSAVTFASTLRFSPQSQKHFMRVTTILNANANNPALLNQVLREVEKIEVEPLTSCPAHPTNTDLSSPAK